MRAYAYSVTIIFLGYWFGTIGGATNEGCKVPEKLAHGNYITDNSEASPGDVVASLIVAYVCDSEYELVGPQRASCNAGVWSETPHIPECIPHCNIENKTKIVTYPSGDGRCSIPETFTNRMTGRKRIRSGGESCGSPRASHQVIAGGGPVLPRELPWHAAVYRKTSSPYMQICGGSLVSHRVVISAAHCFWSDVEKLLPAANFAVAVGKRYRPWADSHDDAQHSDVSDIKVPPRYHGGATNFQDDLALLVLTSPVEFNFNVIPVCLDFDHELEAAQLQPGNLGKVGGWGLTAADGEASPVLKAVQIPYVSIERCLQESEPYFLSFITSDKICAGHKNGTAVCKGDSGGGLVFPKQNEQSSDQYYLRGVVSTAPTDGHLCNVHAWTTFTLLSKHENFIRRVMSELS